MIIRGFIEEVYEYKTKRHAGGFGDSAKFEEASAGWLTRLNIGGTITRLVTDNRPDLSEGPVEIRISNAKSR